MKLLILSGHGINMNVNGARLNIKNGRCSKDENPEELVYYPRRIDVNHIVIYGKTGNITLDAIKWLMKHNVQLSILNWDGKLLTTMLPCGAVQIETKFSQYSAYKDSSLRLELAKNLIRAKFSRTQTVLDYLKNRYSEVNNNFSKEEINLSKAMTIAEVMITEGRVASFYWQELSKILPDKYEFETREYQKRPRGASDTINCMLNYGYAILEAECLRAINSAGLDPHIGFMHEKHLGKNSLAYDLQEPFRFLIDLSIISLIENNVMEKKDFIRTENYTLRLRPSGTRKLLAEIDKQLNKKVEYGKQLWSWRYVIQDKATELSHFLQGKKRKINFSEPQINLQRHDNEEIRQIIKNISYYKWKKLGYSKGTLHYMKQNAKSEKPFTLNKHVKERLRNMQE